MALPNTPPQGRLRQLLLGACIVAAVLAAYLPAMRAGFIWDDEFYCTDNPDVRVASRFGQLWIGPQPTMHQYYPLTTTSFWLEYRLWGASPRGYHVTNILLHALGAVLLWRLLRRLALPGAWLAAMLWALHPVGVATVAWVAERKNLLSLVLGLLFLHAFLRFEATRRWRCYAAAAAFFVAALLSKTAIAPLVLVPVLWAWWARGRITQREVALVAPLLVPAGVLAAVTIHFERALTSTQTSLDLDPASRLALAGRSIWFYLGKAIWPANLSVIYQRWAIDPHRPATFLPLLGALIAAAALLWFRRRGWARATLFALGFYALILLPASGLVNINLMIMTWVADHWQYVSLIGLCALAAGLVAAIARRGPRARAAAAAVSGAVLVLFFAQSFSRARTYTNEITLWTDNITKNPGAFTPYDARGFCYERAGEVQRALADYNQALALNPLYVDAYANRGNAYWRLGEVDKAFADYDKAIALSPSYVGSYNDRGNAYARLGELDKALADYDAAIRLDPSRSEFYSERAGVYSQQGEYEKAMADFGRALALKPKDPSLYYNRGNASFRARQFDRAVGDYTEALRLRPRYAEAMYNRSLAWYQLGKHDEALTDLNASGRLGHKIPDDYLAELKKATGQTP